MPEICRFYGIVIFMNYNEHDPPHFHARYQEGEVFEPLKAPEFFQQVKVNADTRTVEWPNGADFAPEFLYESGTALKKSA